MLILIIIYIVEMWTLAKLQTEIPSLKLIWVIITACRIL